MKKEVMATALMMFGLSIPQAKASVTLYGIVDAGVVYQKVDGTWNGADYSARNFGFISGGQSAGRWGIKGAENLGNGIRAIFQLESGLDIGDGKSTQGNRLFGRHATVGLKSQEWGQLDLGRQTNLASKYGNSTVDPFLGGFKQSAVGSSFSAMGTVRYDNMAMYRTPTIAGFQFGIGYSFAIDGEQNWGLNDANTKNDRAITTGIKYERGPLAMFAAYDQINLGEADSKFTAWSLGASYDLDVVKLSMAFGQTKDGWFAGRNYGPLGTGTFVSAEGLKVNSYMVGVVAPLGNGSIRASWQMADPTHGANASASGAFVGDNLSSQQVLSLGYTYSISKRTSLYAYGSYAKHVLLQDDLTSTLFSAGLRHTF
ncbi:porin [Advenella incenata]